MMVGGWNREKVKNYAALANICPEAWVMIGTTFHDPVPSEIDGPVPSNGTGVPPLAAQASRHQALGVSP